MINYTVRAQWDEQAKVWVTDGEDILGLCVEAASFDQLFEIILAAPWTCCATMPDCRSAAGSTSQSPPSGARP